MNIIIRVKYSDIRDGCRFLPRELLQLLRRRRADKSVCMGAQCVFGILAVSNNVTGIKIHTFTPVLTFFVRFFSRFCKTLGDDLSDPPRSGAVVSLLRTIFNNNSSMHVYTRHTHIITYIILIYIWALGTNLYRYDE